VGQIGALTSHWLIKSKKIKEAHNPEVAGSNPASATEENPSFDGFFVYRHLALVGCNIVLIKRIYQNQQLENE